MTEADAATVVTVLGVELDSDLKRRAPRRSRRPTSEQIESRRPNATELLGPGGGRDWCRERPQLGRVGHSLTAGLLGVRREEGTRSSTEDGKRTKGAERPQAVPARTLPPRHRAYSSRPAGGLNPRPIKRLSDGSFVRPSALCRR